MFGEFKSERMTMDSSVMIDTEVGRKGDVNEEVPPTLIDLYLFNRDENFQSLITRKPNELVTEFSKLLSQAYV